MIDRNDLEMTRIGKFCSNFDHEIDAEVCALLSQKPGKVCADYPGWDFFATVHVDPETGEWCAKVMCYGSVAARLRAKTPATLKKAVCDQFGNA